MSIAKFHTSYYNRYPFFVTGDKIKTFNKFTMKNPILN